LSQAVAQVVILSQAAAVQVVCFTKQGKVFLLLLLIQ